MIRVTVEIVPYGQEGGAQDIGQLILANVGKNGLGFSRYEAVYKTEGQEPIYVRDVSHMRQDGFWPLIQKILSKKGGNEKSHTLERLAKRLTV